MPVVALPVKLISSGPVLFRRRRCGLGGRLFACYKFRSMDAKAESRKAEVEHLNKKSGPAFKIRDDPPTTNAGQYLRRLSIDEASVLERAAERDVVRRTATGDSLGGRRIRNLAAKATADASGPDLPVGGPRAGQLGFRKLDVDGSGIHRQPVAMDEPADPSPDSASGTRRPGGALRAGARHPSAKRNSPSIDREFHECHVGCSQDVARFRATARRGRFSSVRLRSDR